MKGPERLKYFQGNWPTNKGGWFPEEKKVMYREKSLFDDFDDLSWAGLVLYGVKGEIPTKNQSLMLETIWSMCTSYPDPRIWNNRVAALAGTVRTSGQLAHSVAMAISEAKIYGGQPAFLGATWLLEIVKSIKNNTSVEDLIIEKLKKDRYLPGFGRPLVSEDERIKPFLAKAEKLGWAKGQMLNLVEEIKRILIEKKYRIRPNIAIYITAIMADMGYTPYETYMLATLTFSAGILPCFLDALEKPEGTLFPLDTSAIEYTGINKREFSK